MIQKVLPFTEVEQSDTHGLTVNISVPMTSHKARLPVFAFVCGGGWMTGSAVYPHYDLGPITRMSLDLGQPMIAVGIK